MLDRSDSADSHAALQSNQLQLWSMAPAGGVPLRLYIWSIDVCTCLDRGGNSLEIILVNLQGCRARLRFRGHISDMLAEDNGGGSRLWSLWTF